MIPMAYEGFSTFASMMKEDNGTLMNYVQQAEDIKEKRSAMMRRENKREYTKDKAKQSSESKKRGVTASSYGDDSEAQTATGTEDSEEEDDEDEDEDDDDEFEEVDDDAEEKEEEDDEDEEDEDADAEEEDTQKQDEIELEVIRGVKPVKTEELFQTQFFLNIVELLLRCSSFGFNKTVLKLFATSVSSVQDPTDVVKGPGGDE